MDRNDCWTQNMNESIEWREWDLQGLEVTQLCFDHQLTMTMWSRERHLSIKFQTQISFCSADGCDTPFDPEQTTTLSPLLSLLHCPLACFRASSDGHCEVFFQDGTRLSCAPDGQYEAWDSQGSGDLSSASLLCGPGGGSPWG